MKLLSATKIHRVNDRVPEYSFKWKLEIKFITLMSRQAGSHHFSSVQAVWRFCLLNLPSDYRIVEFIIPKNTLSRNNVIAEADLDKRDAKEF